jgi:hypothetical protein
MTLKNAIVSAITATLFTCGGAAVYADSSSTMGVGGSATGGVEGSSVPGAGEAPSRDEPRSSDPSSVSPESRAEDDAEKSTGLDRADEAAGEHGDQGRENARAKQERDRSDDGDS